MYLHTKKRIKMIKLLAMNVPLNISFHPNYN